MEALTLDRYDSNFSEVDLLIFAVNQTNLDTTKRLTYGNPRSLEDAIQCPELICPRTRWNFNLEHVMEVEDFVFCWHRGFVLLADWAMSIPQFRQLPPPDQVSFGDKQATLCRLSYSVKTLPSSPSRSTFLSSSNPQISASSAVTALISPGTESRISSSGSQQFPETVSVPMLSSQSWRKSTRTSSKVCEGWNATRQTSFY